MNVERRFNGPKLFLKSVIAARGLRYHLAYYV